MKQLIDATASNS